MSDNTPTTMRPEAHSIVWTLNHDYVTASAECGDDDCISRYTCDLECEVIYDIRRDGAGVSHGLYDWNDEIKPHVRHQMTRGGYCNVVEFLNADEGVIPEMNEARETFEIGRTAIEPVWQGEDGVLWKRLTPTATTPEKEAHQ